MNKLITSLLLTLAVLFGGMVAPAAATSPTVAQFCVDFTDSGDYSPHLAEDYATWEQMRGHRVAAFVNSPAGCAGLSREDGEVWNGPNPFPAPVTPTCDPEVRTIVETVEVVRTIADPALVRKVERQRATIKKLRAKIRALR